MDDTINDGARLQMGGEAALAEQDPRTWAALTTSSNNCIQFRGERHRRWGPRLWRPRASSARQLSGLMSTPQVGSGPPAGRRGAAPMPIEPSPITQTLVCSHAGLLGEYVVN